MKTTTPLAKFGSLLALALLLIVGSACDSVVGSDDDDDHDDHDGELASLSRVELETRDGTGTTVATWNEDTGWDVDGLTVEMPDDGDHPVWTVRMFDEDGDEFTLEEGGEFEAQYAVDNDAPQDVIYFDGSGEIEFEGDAAARYGDEGELFHGDHVHVYPQSEGTTQIRFLLWHGNHSDDSTDLLDLTVEGHDDEVASVEIEKRDGSGETLATWTEENGWDTDALPALEEGGDFSGWTVRMFAEDGDEIELEEGGEFEARYAVDSEAPQDVIYFDSSGEVELADGSEGELFHGDHVHVYPQNAGTTQLRFLLWHDNHADAETALIDLTVQE